MIPFCETRISEIERIQSQVAKFILGISSSCSNICAQTELGLKPFRQLLFECQLKFYFRALYLHADRWVHQALLDHLSGDWHSPYLLHMSSIRSTLSLFEPEPAPSTMKGLVGKYFLAQLNSKISAFKWIAPVTALSRSSYVCENEYSSIIAEFKLDNPGLGEKRPLLGHNRKPFCPLCPVRIPSSGFHMLFECSSISVLRINCGIQSYILQCEMKGLSLTTSYKYFVNGNNSNGKPIPQLEFLERGKCMKIMRDLWLSKWSI